MASPVRDTLEAYVAGRVKADGVVAVVVAAYYGDRGRGKRARLEPLIAVIERASPGVVELTETSDRPGFDVRLVQRRFPQEFEAELRRAVDAYLARETPEPKRPPSVMDRLLGVLRWLRMRQS